MSQSVLNLTFVDAAVGPLVHSLACDSVVSELALIFDSIGPCEFALAA